MSNIEIQITNGTRTISVSPQSIEIPDMRGMSDSLQHEEQVCRASILFDEDLLSFLLQEQNVQAVIHDGATTLFTGIINGSPGWTDNGFPEPAATVDIEIHDRTKLLDKKAEGESVLIDGYLSVAVQRICTNCGVTCQAAFNPDPVVDALVIQEGTLYLDLLTNLLFQYKYSWYFDEYGSLRVLHLDLEPSGVEEALDDKDFLSGLKISPAVKSYGAVKVSYSTLVKKQNEQVYWEGNGFNSDGSVLPIVLRPGQYYPYESDPTYEASEGKVTQKFESGYAESYRSYSGEQKFRRSSGMSLVYTENHHVVEDWDSGVTVNRTEFGAKTAAVRLLNTGSEDASVMQLAIKADAYYHSSDNYVTLGSGKEYTYDAEHLYDMESAETFAEMLVRLYTGQGANISGNLEHSITPGTVYNIDSGASGLTAYAVALSCTYNPETCIYSASFMTVSTIQITPQMFRKTRSRNALSSADYNTAVINSEIIKIKDGGADIEAPGFVTGLSAEAGENSISLAWNPLPADGLRNAIKQYSIEISKDSGSNWQSCGASFNTSFEYVFIRNTDGYPSSATLATWRFRVRSVNLYGKTSVWTTTAVDSSTYLSWEPPRPANVKAKAYKDHILLTWTCDTSHTYGTNLFSIKRNGTVIASGISGNSYAYYFNRNSGEYPEASAFASASWTFTVSVSNESGSTANSPSATYDTSDYLTWIPPIPMVGATTSGRTVILEIQPDDTYWGWSRYELQISKDGLNWFAANVSSSYNPYTSEDGWKSGAQGDDTDLYSRQFSMEMPLEGQTTNAPADTIYQLRVRTINHTNQDNASAFSDVITVYARASGAKDIVNSAITTEKLANNAVTADKIAAESVTAEKISAVAVNKINPFTGSDTHAGDTSVSGWTLSDGCLIDVDSMTMLKCLSIGSLNSNPTPEVYTDFFEVKPDEILKFSCTIDSTQNPTRTIYVGVYPYSTAAVNGATNSTYMVSEYNFTTGAWSSWVRASDALFASWEGARKSFSTYICGSEIQTKDLPSPARSSSDIAIRAFRCFSAGESSGSANTNYNKCAIRLGLSGGSGSVSSVKIIAPLVTSATHRGTVVAEDIKTEKLSSITANLGDVASGSIASAVTTSGSPDPNNSLMYFNGKSGSEEFYIGNVSKSNADETDTNHEFLWLHKVNNVFKFVLKVTNFIVTSVQAVIKGILRVKDSFSDSDTDAFLTVNPTTTTDGGTPAKTMSIKGDLSTTGKIITTPDTIGIEFRNNHNTYKTNISYQTSGNEALVFATKYAATSFIFANGEDTETNISSDRWKSLVPGLQIKNNKVAIGKLISSGTTPSYALDVNGTVKASGFEGNVTGNCSGSSGSCTGNAESADYSRQGAYCTTAKATAAKTASMRGFSTSSRGVFLITFENENTATSNLTLNINSTGAYPLYVDGTRVKNFYKGTYLCKWDTAQFSITKDYSAVDVLNASYSDTSGTSYSCSGNAATASDSSKLGGISVRTSSIGGTSAETSNHWAYIVKAKFVSTSGYLVLSNGLKIEWGRSDESTALKTYQLNLAYTAKHVFLSRVKRTNIANGGGVDYAPQVQDIDTNHIKIDQANSDVSYSFFLVIGY